MRIFAVFPQALREVFGFFGGAGHVVSLVGGGGKSTLMYLLLGTTTNIYIPDGTCYAKTEEEVRALWDQGKFAVIGTPVPDKGKLRMPEENFLREMLSQADVAFLEADGAKHYPTKVPKAGEPVLLPESDLVMAVFGLSAIGSPLKEICFRLEEAMQLLGVAEDHILTEADAAAILASPLGGRKGVGQRKYCVVLNQCDDGKRRRSANEIAARLSRQGIDRMVMTAFDPEEREFYGNIAKGV